MKPGFRLLCLGGFAFTVASMLFALYLQHYKGFEPCPMCIFQRVAMMTAGLFFLLGAIHGPQGAGRWVYAALADIAAITGALIAARHVWLQSLPESERPACGPTLDYLREIMPLNEVITYVLKGEGSCAKIDAAWLGLSLPFWTMIGFIALSMYAILMPVVARIFERRGA